MTVALLNDPRIGAVMEILDEPFDRLFPVPNRIRLDIDDVLDAYKLLDPIRHQAGAGTGDCFYRQGRLPDCIGGTIIHLLAPDIAARLQEGYGLHEQVALLAERFTDAAILLLNEAQQHADGGKDWGDAMFDAMRGLLRVKTSAFS